MAANGRYSCSRGSMYFAFLLLPLFNFNATISTVEYGTSIAARHWKKKKKRQEIAVPHHWNYLS